jgi:peptide/nickel transport system permease protein
MVKVIGARIMHSLLSLLFLLILGFSLVRLSGDPINFLVEPTASPAQKQMIREQLGLDRSIPIQFVDYLGQLARGDLGLSFRYRAPVVDLIEQRLPNTLLMATAAVLLMIAVAVPLGVQAAYRQGTSVDLTARGIAALGQAVPDFWLGLMLILVFAVNLKWFPAGGYGGVSHLVLPAITLSFAAIAGLTRLLRSSMIEVLNSDYVLFLRARGTPEPTILWKHSLRNAGLTSLSFIGVVIGGLVTGSVLVETIFNWPGIGLLFIEAVRNRDFGVAQGVMLFFGVAYIVSNLLVDVLYMRLNPRLR